MELGRLGTRTDADGSASYDTTQNPLLLQGVVGWNSWTPLEAPMNPDTLGKPQFAALVAGLTGGEVVTAPGSEQFQMRPPGTRMLAVRRTLYDPATREVIGEKVANAGAIGMVMGNDVWKANVRAKSVEISELLGIFPPDQTLADRIWDALFPPA